jgi:hypothetical protein
LLDVFGEAQRVRVRSAWAAFQPCEEVGNDGIHCIGLTVVGVKLFNVKRYDCRPECNEGSANRETLGDQLRMEWGTAAVWECSRARLWRF